MRLLSSLVLAFLTLPAFAQTQSINDTTGYSFGDYWISAWTQNWNFNQGSFVRTWQGNNAQTQLWYLWINLDNSTNSTSVGFDAGVGKTVPGQVSYLSSYGGGWDSAKINDGIWYQFGNDLKPKGSAYWWMGPKTIISEEPYYIGLDEQYECYVVDNCNLSPGDLADRLGLNYNSETEHDGAVYKHYTVRFGNINQVWSIRQSYRSGGWSATNWIQREWYLRGMVPWWYHNLGWKVNIETAGGFNAGSNCGFYDLSLPTN